MGTVGQRVVETAPGKSSLGPGSGGKSMKIASLGAGIDPAACVRTRVVAQGCFSLPKLICAAFGMILERKTYQIN